MCPTSSQGTPKLRSPVALDIFENNMFYVNAEDGAVMQMDKFGRGVPVTVSAGYSNPKAVRVVHPLKYNQTLSNPCSEKNRALKCSHLCLTVPGGSRCKCPQGNSFLDGARITCDARKLEREVNTGWPIWLESWVGLTLILAAACTFCLVLLMGIGRTG